MHRIFWNLFHLGKKNVKSETRTPKVERKFQFERCRFLPKRRRNARRSVCSHKDDSIRQITSNLCKTNRLEQALAHFQRFSFGTVIWFRNGFYSVSSEIWVRFPLFPSSRKWWLGWVLLVFFDRNHLGEWIPARKHGLQCSMGAESLCSRSASKSPKPLLTCSEAGKGDGSDIPLGY